ncbi:MAG: hypothetical protein WCK89_19990, partial [bacterium]
VRQSASLSVINLLGTDSVNFIRKAANDGRHSRMDMYGMFESFGFQIQVAKKKNPKVNLDEAVGFLLGIADKEEKGMTDSYGAGFDPGGTLRNGKESG